MYYENEICPVMHSAVKFSLGKIHPIATNEFAKESLYE